ncbi:MAG: radical SAM protein, partial [Nitrospinae bacterium]|nr:radical SAM protein [Nitrospinota bacterium]
MRLNSKHSGLYLHIPYCLHKCGYCDFNSHKINTEEMDQYVEALIREIDTYSQSSGPTSGKIIETIFFGGGTPTTLPVKSLARILETCRDRFPLSPDCEVTLEANPATILKDELKDLRSAGFNRLSVGVQSFHKKDLDLLERVHSVEEIYLTLDRAREAGFDNLSIDLMF